MVQSARLGARSRRGIRLSLLISVVSLALAGPATADDKATASGLESEIEAFTGALVGGKPWLDARYRFEHVDQAGLPRDANAHTLRARVGYRTGVYRGFSALAEGEGILHLGDDDFNDTLNGKTAYPVVADPESLAINQLYLQYDGFPDTRLRGGRQVFVLDNQRYIGHVGFRQNQQTFDAVTATNTSIADTRLTYGYIFQVLRIFGEDSPVGSFNTDSHVFNASYSGFDVATLTAYAYLLDIEDLPARSTMTFGLRAAGSYDLGKTLAEGVKALYAAEVARQFDHANNPADYDVGYYLVEGGLGYQGLTAKLGYEVLDGNGTQAFQTPLATLHKFQGWADRFLVTPAGGIRDFYASLGYKVKGLGPLDGLKLLGVYHDFSAENGGGDYGHEFDFVVSKKLFKHFTVAFKYANYQSDGFATDTEKIWLSLGAKF
ncbi:MAG: alginate export family protein [Alphaproteobacteria bacterium]|nr:alginate export family protein [Alphaproteobacteria bacterium]